jgi:hypothetical protein
MTPEELELALEKIQNSINLTDDEKWNLMMKLQAMEFIEREQKRVVNPLFTRVSGWVSLIAKK